jgi:hypothetical protein
MKVHVHIYGDNGDSLESEHDLEMIEEYPDPNGYKQYGLEVEGKWVEIRISE